MRRLACLIAFAFLPRAAAAEPGAVDKAMGAEIERAMSLHEEGYPSPYYVSLTATDVESREQRCEMGEPVSSAQYRQRVLTPDVRVGDYSLDNHPITPAEAMVGHPVSLEDDEFSLRYALWRMLDEHYKKAAADFLLKQAQRVGRGKTEYDTDDLSREAPGIRRAQSFPAAWDAEGLRELCAKGSGVFRTVPGLLDAEADVKWERQSSRLRDSEGAIVKFGRQFAEIELSATALSSDGMRLFAARRFTVAGGASPPSALEIERGAREMLEDLRQLQMARSTSPFSAPALLDPSVSAAVMLATGLRLSGEELRNPNGAQTFRDKMGKRVLSEELTLEDDPTLASFGGEPLAGHYDYDDQGMAPQKVRLIDRGVLKGFLLSRYPVIGFPRSNGHGRAYPGYVPEGAPGSLLLSSERPLPEKDLLVLLRKECRRRGKRYGLWIRKLRDFTQQQGAAEQGAIRFMPGLVYLVEAESGRLTLVRDLDIVGTPLELLGNIMRAGDDVRPQNFLVGGVPMSAVVPSLLLKDVELQRAETKPERPPILQPPAVPGEPR